MKSDNEKTTVIFRKHKDGNVIAFFPDTYKSGTMMSYQHIGQHSEADIMFYYECKKARPEEYADLLYELQNIVGYTNLTIKQRMSFK